MSHVTAVILMVGLPDGEDDALRILADVNAHFGGPSHHLKWVDDAFGGSKHPQALVAGGGIDHLDISAFLRHLERIDWPGHDCAFAQAAIQDENNQGFGFVEIFRDPSAEAPWSLPPAARPSPA